MQTKTRKIFSLLDLKYSHHYEQHPLIFIAAVFITTNSVIPYFFIRTNYVHFFFFFISTVFDELSKTKQARPRSLLALLVKDAFL